MTSDAEFADTPVLRRIEEPENKAWLILVKNGNQVIGKWLVAAATNHLNGLEAAWRAAEFRKLIEENPGANVTVLPSNDFDGIISNVR